MAIGTLGELQKAAQRKKVEKVTVGFGDVHLRPMSLVARDQVLKARDSNALASAAILAATVCDADGKLIASDPEEWRGVLEEGDATELDELIKHACRVSGLDVDANERAEGN
jgi:hypothetical protein